MNERQQRFIDLLKQIFEIDKADLDFGIYRILNIRRKEITDFFTNKLPQQITDTLAPFATDGKDEIKAKMTAIEQQAASFGVSAESNPEYQELKRQLQQGTDISALESDVYSALYSFFSRYYDEGDFISKRRYKEGVYAIPYEGEEVKLYWANQDQYYIKTAENFKDYTFKTDNYTVHFRLVDATTEQNNNKETDDNKRKFMIFTEDEENYPGIKTFEVKEQIDGEGNVVEREYIVRFIYDVPENKKGNWDEINFNAIREDLSKETDTQLQLDLLKVANPSAIKKDQITVLQKHLKAYVAKNSFDYFIHKDLGGFLTRELDFFIKNEIMHLDDLDTANEARVNTYLAKVRAIKRVGKTIITFLAQIENFQKKLWLKKKFVVETNWCITLDHIDEKFYDEIRKNKAQVQEWIDMYAINEIETDLDHTEPWTDVPSLLFLKQNKNLIVDTKHFSDEFKNKLIASIDNLDEETGGLMINSDNYQALKLLVDKYSELIDCVHIDPPYNTDTSGFLYKNNYRHSSWMSMMDDRIDLTKRFLSSDSSFICHIDENEYERLFNILSTKGLYNLGTIVWDKRNPMTGGGGIALQHEYITWFSPDNITISVATENAKCMINKVGELIKQYGCVNDEVRFEYSAWLKSNELLSKGDREYKYISDDGRIFQSISLRAPEPRTNPKFHIPLIHPVTHKPCPVPPNGFSRTPETHEEMIRRGEIIFGKDETIQPRYKMFLTDVTKKQLTSVISNAIKGTSDLKKLGLTFPYCHSISFYDTILKASLNRDKEIVMDYFAGSGTTANVIININRQTGNENKYIEVEMGDYFSKVTLPRTKKVIYSSNWSDGKPVFCNNGYSHIMKYLRLESYEDALSNVALQKQEGLQSIFGDDYLINYMFDLEAKESLLNLKAFKTPFEYEMRITEKNECKEQRVDVCETFNYLIGLTVIRQGEIKYFSVKKARHPEYEEAVDLATDANGEYAFRQIEGKLRDGRRALIIWRSISNDLMESNKALDAYFTKYRINPLDRDYDVIYVNGDCNIENLRTDDESWKVVRTETEFNKRMFEED